MQKKSFFISEKMKKNGKCPALHTANSSGAPEMKKRKLFINKKHTPLFELMASVINPLIPEAHYCERRDKLDPLQDKLLEDSGS